MRLPDYHGPGLLPPGDNHADARAWSLDLPAIRARHGLPADGDAGIAVWVIDSPGSHPVWWWYRLSLIHLRPRFADDLPLIYLPGATHELVLEALDPTFYPPPVDDIPPRFLIPANFAAQLRCPSDAAAIKTVETQAILPLMQGTLHPDTDFRRLWIDRFGDNMIKGGVR
jgi:hypothetical protein